MRNSHALRPFTRSCAALAGWRRLRNRQVGRGLGGWGWGTIALHLAIISLAAPGHAAVTDSTNDAPAAVQTVLTQLDRAANGQDLDELMALYDPQFRHADGLTRSQVQATIADLWALYPNLTYDVELVDWQALENGYETETIVTLRGTRQADRNYTLTSTIRSRQTYINGLLASQTVLAERSTTQAGDQPPTVEVRLPETVRPGASFDFDAIVQEPLGDDFLLGGAIDEPVSSDGYTNPATIELEPLSAGGLFKTGTAPTEPGDLWVSGVIVRQNGITMTTQRLTVRDDAS